MDCCLWWFTMLQCTSRRIKVFWQKNNLSRELLTVKNSCSTYWTFISIGRLYWLSSSESCASLHDSWTKRCFQSINWTTDTLHVRIYKCCEWCCVSKQLEFWCWVRRVDIEDMFNVPCSWMWCFEQSTRDQGCLPLSRKKILLGKFQLEIKWICAVIFRKIHLEIVDYLQR